MAINLSDSEEEPSTSARPSNRGRKPVSYKMTVDSDADSDPDAPVFGSDEEDGSDFEISSSAASKKQKAAPKAPKAAKPPKAPKAPKAPKVAKTTKAAKNGTSNGDATAPSSSASPELIEESGANNSNGNGSSSKNASSQYQKLTQLEHILKRPDTYIGSVEKTEMKMWVYDEPSESMNYRDVSIVPGLYKIFDEILVNAADNKIRDPSMDTLDVTIDPENNTISVLNNGKGIPIEIHEKEKIYIPELIFGNLLTSSNYDDNEKKVTGGRNGYGAKVCLFVVFMKFFNLIFLTNFIFMF